MFPSAHYSIGKHREFRKLAIGKIDFCQPEKSCIESLQLKNFKSFFIVYNLVIFDHPFETSMEKFILILYPIGDWRRHWHETTIDFRMKGAKLIQGNNFDIINISAHIDHQFQDGAIYNLYYRHWAIFTLHTYIGDFICTTYSHQCM